MPSESRFNLDREALVQRNRHMTETLHVTPPKHFVRRGLLRMAACLPISRQKPLHRERFLLIRPDHLGDVLLTTPAISALRRAKPRAEIHALVGPWSAGVLGNLPDLDAVLTLPFPGFDRGEQASLHGPYEQALRSARHLRRIGYTHAVIMRHDHWWGGLLAFLAGIPDRVGYQKTDLAPFLTDAHPFNHEHAVLQNTRLIQRWIGKVPDEKLALRFELDDIDRSEITAFLEQHGIDPQQPIICIHPGSGTWAKQWEAASWAAVADTLVEQLNAQIVLTGSHHEIETTSTIARHMKHPVCVVAGDTDLRQLAALMERAIIALGPDSGPMHLAAAVSTPTVTLFGPADPVEFGPWGPRDQHIVLTTDIGCRPCRVLDWEDDNPENHPCVREITVSQVLGAVHSIINSS